MKYKKPAVTLGHWRRFPFRFPFTLAGHTLKVHKHVMGTTGQGKSKLLAHMTASMILQGVGSCLVDPHSDLAHDVLTLLYDNGYFNRPDAYEKVLYVDFSRTDRFIPFNILAKPATPHRSYSVHEVARNIVEVCTRAWAALADGAAPLFENIMLSSIPVLIENNLPLTALDSLLTNKGYRDSLLQKCKDPKIISFFHDQFDQWGREQPTMIGSALRRAFLLAYTPALRFSLGQTANSLSFRELLDNNTSLIVNLGGLDEQTQRILGCLITVGYEVASLSRADIPEHQRSIYNLIMDEFSMFSAQSEEALERVLSLCRKYNLFLTMANQNFSQLSERFQGALQNAMPIYFRLGYDDAVWAAPRIGRSNPYHKKHEVKAIKEKELTVEHHPVYFHMQEEYEAWARKIEGLWPQEAYVKYPRRMPARFERGLFKFLRFPGHYKRIFRNTKTVKIRTVTIPPSKARPEIIQQIKDYYAEKLMKRKGEIETVFAPPQPAPQPVVRSRSRF